MFVQPSLTIEHRENYSVVALTGEFDLDVADTLSDALSVAVQMRRRVVVDLAATEFIDSVSLGCLVLAAKTARGAGGWVRLAAPSRGVRRLLKLTGLETLFGVFETVESAVAVEGPDLVDVVPA